MFDEEIKATFAAQARAMAAQINTLAAQNYIQACQNWALQGAGLPPLAAFSVAAQVSFVPEFSLKLSPTQEPVSEIKPESFLPKFATDTDAVGGPVGGPIPGAPGKFYAVATSSPQPGDDYRAAGSVYIYKKPTPFAGFWVKL
ncbi:hypothetical protein UFOVP836_55 [uncultured Caudovirales phage]|uniref:Uncharacterized protein n=1 Tax=uncultured Caudovirales phage TaxID=2100421 RepID=A0A6J5PBZ2_9CAUD|nr:hypothetical protein UFOVP836_55 [uncultured Caudovirales phage]